MGLLGETVNPREPCVCFRAGTESSTGKVQSQCLQGLGCLVLVATLNSVDQHISSDGGCVSRKCY